MVYLVEEPKLSEGFVVQEYSKGAFRASGVDLAERDLPHAEIALDMICHSLQTSCMQLNNSEHNLEHNVGSSDLDLIKSINPTRSIDTYMQSAMQFLRYNALSVIENSGYLAEI